MSIYIISDTHFNHTRQMIEYCQRPANYEALLFTNLLSLKESDLLIHLGDITIGRDTEIHEFIKSLKCRKILVRGNHDKKSNTWYLKHGWDFVCKEFRDKLFSKDIVFSHEPVERWCDINIHGHIHNKEYKGLSNQKLFALEYQGYRAVSLEKFINK